MRRRRRHPPLPLPLLLVAINSHVKVQTDIRPFSHRLRRATIRLLSATPYILSLRDRERVTAAKRELCLGAPPPSSPGLESESTRTLPISIPFSPPSADIVIIVAICLERSLLSPGDTGPHTSLPPVTYGLERDGVGPCQSRLWTCEGSATCRTLHRCRCRWHSGEKLSENRDAILFTLVRTATLLQPFYHFPLVPTSTINLVQLLSPTYPALAFPSPAPSYPSRAQVKPQSKSSLLPRARQVFHHTFAQTV